MRTLLLAVLFSASTALWAQPFDAFPEWDNETRYKRGTVVQHLSHLWVARLPNAGRPPHEYPLWARAELVDLPEWQERRWYPLGATVIYEGTPYLARQVTRHHPDHPAGTKKWIPFDHPALGYDLPVIDETQAQATLLGVDSNDNGIRDDYEVFVVMSYTGKTRDMGLLAGRSYQLALKAEQGVAASWPESEVVAIVDTLANLIPCKRELRRQDGEFQGFEFKQFNTVDRFMAHRRSQQILYDLLGEGYRPTFDNQDPCGYVASNSAFLRGQYD
ncbi:hypothetical protein [Ferrimonas balearica]|uniref:hypothetical protein n=1 Tax=Ferrimonas balearica TaxID=44012 RepID=UPI001C993201|nr:hypothetical protein [Ferrimonas balearica]MBY5992221.1 hypothetical protein [Ferrimonas balearica]